MKERSEDLIFAEEIAVHTNPFYQDPNETNVRHGMLDNKHFAAVYKKCYPTFKVNEIGSMRPLLVPANVLGSRDAIDQYLALMAQELESKVDNGHCHYPIIHESPVMNYLYYTGAFHTASTSVITLPWGTGMVQSLEKPCLNQYLENSSTHYKAQLDMVKFDFNVTGLIVNRYEATTATLESGETVTFSPPAPIVYNYLNCGSWVTAFLKLHGELTGQKHPDKTSNYLEILEHNIFNSVVDRSDIAGGEELNPMKTSYQRSTVVQQAPWFPAEKKCETTCCAQAIAISLEPDKDHLITSVDGLDLGDVAVVGHDRSESKKYLQWAVSDLIYDIIPCLQKGTIIYADHEGGGAKRFFDIYRPLIKDPYVLVTGGTDGIEPLKPHFQGREILETDELLTAWYGINPCYICGANHSKFHMMHLGLSAKFDQQKFLAARLNQRGFGNPFAADKKKRWTESMELATANDATRLIFVKFGINAHSQHR